MKLIRICKIDTESDWMIVSNMTKDENYKASQIILAKIILANPFNEYVQWKNCGVIYRIVRDSDVKDYIK